MNSTTTGSHRSPGERTRAAALAVALAVACTSCAISRPAPVKNTFLLDPAAPSAASVPRPAALRMGQVSVAAPFRDKTFVYRKSELAYEADFYSTFFVAPSAMLTEATAKGLDGAGVFRRLIPPGAVADDGDYALDGFVSELYGDARSGSAPAAVLSVTFFLSVADSTPANVFWSKEYRQRVATTDASPDALAKAWNTALTAILAELARDLAAAPLPRR